MIYYLLLDRKERYPSYEDEDLPPRNDVGQSLGGRRKLLSSAFTFREAAGVCVCGSGASHRYSLLLPIHLRLFEDL